MDPLSAADILEARRLAEELGLHRLSGADLGKLLSAARIANARRDALDVSALTPADEPALVFRLPATGSTL
jgi:hypothetical protein